MPQRRLFVSDSLIVLQNAFGTALQTLKHVDPLTSVVVLVPHEALVLHLQQTVLSAEQGFLGVSFCTWSTFAREVAEWSFIQEGKQPLPLFAGRRVVRQLLSEETSENYFAPLVQQPGFAHGFLATLTDLKQAGVRPQDLRTFIERTHLTGVYRHKIESLYTLYDGYERFLNVQLFYDEEDLLERATQILSVQGDPMTFFLYGFSDFTPLRRRVVEAAIHERDALVFLPWRTGPAYEYATPTLGWLTSLGFQQSSLSAPVTEENNLTRLQARIFEGASLWPTDTPPRPDQSVHILSVPGENREAREIGRIIFDLARERGLHFADIAIALPDPIAYGPLFRETFTEWGIPHAAVPQRALLHTQAGQAVTLLCQVRAENFPRARVFEFLSVARPPFAELLGGLSIYAQPARWETFSRQAGITRSAKEWRERLARLTTMGAQSTPADLDGAPNDVQQVRAFSLFMERFISDSELPPHRHSWCEWAEEMLRLFITYVSPSATAWTQMQELLQRLCQLTMLGNDLSFREWFGAFTEVLAISLEERAQQAQEGVFIGDLATVCAMPFRIVIVPGLIEGRFPQTVRQDPFLLDAERQHLAEVLLCDLQQRYRQGEAERLLLTRTLHSATEQLILTYPRLDSLSGRSHVPSSYLLRSIEAISGRYATLSDLEAWSETVSLSPLYNGPPQQALDALEFHLASIEHARRREHATPLGYLPLAVPFFPQAHEALRKRWGMQRLTPFDGLIEDEGVRTTVSQRLFPTGIALSASALETYARCPFRYFLNTVLGVLPQEDPELLLTLQPRERGALLHEILHDFFSRLQREGRMPLATQDPQKLLHVLQTVARTHFAAFAVTRATGLPVVWEVEQERLLEQLSLLLTWEIEHEKDFLPTAFEAPFGTDSADTTMLFPPGVMQFELDDGGVIHLRGRIDRIDISTDTRHARILDYKSGKPVRGRFAGGTVLQLPLYLYAARHLRPDLQWMAADYVYLNRAERPHEPAFSAETWSEIEADLRAIVTVLASGLRTGCFPQTPDTCQPCAFPLICSAMVETRARRKRHDPRLDGLHSMRRIL
jgi:ATP-dependent helicase/DNAse subunit B